MLGPLADQGGPDRPIAVEGVTLLQGTDPAARLAALPAAAYATTKTILRERTVAHVRATLAMDMARLTPPAAS